MRRYGVWLAICILGGMSIARADYQAVYLNDKPEVRYLVQKIDTLIIKQQWDEAVQKIQELIVEHPGVVFRTTEHHFRGVRHHGLSLLVELPEACRAAYRRRYDPKARRLIETAPGEAGLRLVVARYLFTPTADKAILRLAAIALERGEARQGAYWLEQLLLKHPADKLPGQQVAMLGFCYRRGGMLAPLRALLQRSAKRKLGIRIGNKRRMLAGYLRDLLSDAEADSKRLWNLESWPVFGGNWSQSRIAPFEVSTNKKARWTRSFPTGISKFTYPWRSKPSYRGQLPIRHHASVGGGSVYISNGHMLYAMSLFSGQLLWEAGPLVQRVETPQGKLQPYGVTYHRGSVYANLEIPSEGRPQTWLRYLIRTPLPMRVLVRVAATTGKILWKTSRPKLGADAFVNRISLLCPPVIRGNVAYVAGAYHEGYFKYYLLAFDIRDGSLKWKRRIGGGQQALNLFGRPFRELIGSMPALFGGRIYLCSNLGFISCLDAETGEILWVARYSRLRIPTTQTHLLPPVDVHWYSRPPLVTQGLVISAPVDSRFLYAMDANTGKLRWVIEAEGDHIVLGVTGGKLYTAGRRLRAFFVQSGKMAILPRALKSTEGPVIGQGALTAKVGYVCTRKTMYRFSTSDLRILSRSQPAVLGNLTLVGNVRIAVGKSTRNGPGRVAAYYDWNEFQANLLGMIAKAPQEPFGYNGLASIYAQRGKFEPALKYFKKGLVRARRETTREYRDAVRRARAGIHSLFLARARKLRAQGRIAAALDDLDQAALHAVGGSAGLWVMQVRLDIMAARGDLQAVAELVDQIEELHGKAVIRDGNKQTTAGLAALVRLARLYVGANRGHEAVAVYQRILMWHPEDEFGGLSGKLLAYQAIEQLKKTYDPSIYSKWNQQAIARFRLARQSGSLGELESIRQRYPNCTILPRVILLMARRLIDKSRPIEAKNILQDFLRASKPTAAYLPTARYLLFKALDKNKMYASAKGILLEMVEQYDGVKIQLGEEQQLDLGDYARRRLAEKLYRTLDARPPMRDLKLGSGNSPAWKISLEVAGNMRLLEVGGACPPKYRDRFFVEDGGLLSCRSATDGKSLWKTQAGVQLMGLAWSRGKLIAWMREGLVAAYDPADGRRLWHTQMPGAVGAVRVARGLVAIVVPDSDGRQQQSKMVLLDAVSGQLTWVSQFSAVSVPAPLISRRHLIAWTVRRPGDVLLFDLGTGQVSRPFRLGLNQLISAPVLFGDDRLALPLSRKKLLIYNLWRGEKVREIAVVDGILDSKLMAGQRSILISTGGRELEAYNTSGRRIWRLKLDRQSILRRQIVHEHCFLVTQGFAGMGAQSKQAVVIDMRSGNILWQAYLGDAGTPVWRMVVSQGYLIVQLGYREAMKLVVIDRKTGKRAAEWRVGSSRGAYPTIAGGRLIVAMFDQIHAYGGVRRKK